MLMWLVVELTVWPAPVALVKALIVDFTGASAPNLPTLITRYLPALPASECLLAASLARQGVLKLV